MGEQEFTINEEQGKFRLYLNGQCVGAALQDRTGRWDAEITHRFIGRFVRWEEAKKALWEKRFLALKRSWHDYPYYEF